MKTRQSGSVLAISLVLLTAITLIALMGMQRSGLQTKIVANLQHHEARFNRTLAEVDDLFKTVQQVDTQLLADAAENPTGPIHVTSNMPAHPHIQVNSTLEFQSNGNTIGLPNTSGLRNQTSRGKNGSGYAKFKIASTATMKNGVDSSQLVGLTFITPEI